MDTQDIDLQRFVKAQDSTYQIALSEIKVGKKENHWIWYIFPQLKGFGYSYNSEYYGITDANEAKEYAEHPLLGTRLREMTTTLLQHAKGITTKPIDTIFSPIDTIKVKSCMTLFEAVTHEPIFTQVLDTMFAGQRDQETLKKIRES